VETKKTPKRKDETMTDAELDRMTEDAINGTLDEAAYNRLTAKAIKRGNAMLHGANDTKCEFSGCKNKATWKATKLWGKGGTICTCDDHKPGYNVARMKIDQQNDRQWYRVEPIKA
jgi:hypothetical protein